MGSRETEPQPPTEPTDDRAATGATEPAESPDPLLDPKAHAVTLRDVELGDLVRLLRRAVGLPPDQIGLGERAAAYRRRLPRVVPDVDVEGWIAWTLAGVPLFKGGRPTLRRTRDTAKAIVMVIALARVGGSISGAGLALETSRKVLRDNMRRLGLYPFPRSPIGRP